MFSAGWRIRHFLAVTNNGQAPYLTGSEETLSYQLKRREIMKYGELNLGQVEAIVNKLGGMDGVQRFLRGETTISEPERAWREQDGVVYFSVMSDGTTGEEWINRLESKGFRLSDYAKSVLRSPDFQPTDGVTYEIAVLKGMLFEDSNRVTKKIRAEAKGRGFTTPNAEVACLIREKFSDEEIEAMGLWWIITMHEPIEDSDGSPYLLSVRRRDDGRWLGAYYDFPAHRWRRGDGFAFAVSQV